MKNILLKNTEDTPEVEFNLDEKVYKISGKSLPENAVAFYLPLLNWITQYKRECSEPIIFDFKLDYFNTASAKQITKLLLALQDLSESVDVKVRWYYLKEDTDILSSGLRFQRLIKVKIQLIGYDD